MLISEYELTIALELHRLALYQINSQCDVNTQQEFMTGTFDELHYCNIILNFKIYNKNSIIIKVINFTQ